MSDELPARKPTNLDPLAAELLDALEQRSEAACIILGGGIAMKHYLDYRPTHDVDAWWRRGAMPDEKRAALELVRDSVRAIGDSHNLAIGERTWGSVVSIELAREGKTVCSFQIADRDVELDPPRESPWPPILLETLRDNVAAKMSALVVRGAPRDFTDVYMVAMRGLASIDDVWQLWQRKNPGADVELAKAAVLRHLEEIEMRRPLERMPEADRERLATFRGWVREELTRSPEREQSVDRERRRRGKSDRGEELER